MEARLGIPRFAPIHTRALATAHLRYHPTTNPLPASPIASVAGSAPRCSEGRMDERERGSRGLLIFSGLPGSGKSTVARLVARALGATYVRIDTIEQGLRELCSFDVQEEGYGLAYRIATDNLSLGQTVVADSCNPIELSRREWEEVARDAGVPFANIEIVCTDAAQHRARVESRRPEVAGLRLPTWTDVQEREYHAWTVTRLVIDTSSRTAKECANDLLHRLQETGYSTETPEET